MGFIVAFDDEKPNQKTRESWKAHSNKHRRGGGNENRRDFRVSCHVEKGKEKKKKRQVGSEGTMARKVSYQGKKKEEKEKKTKKRIYIEK